MLVELMMSFLVTNEWIAFLFEEEKNTCEEYPFLGKIFFLLRLTQKMFTGHEDLISTFWMIFFSLQELRSAVRYRTEDSISGSYDVGSVKRTLRSAIHAEV